MESESFINKGYVQSLLTVVLVGVIVALASYAYLALKEADGVVTGNATISVQGEGEVQAVPDIGTFTFMVMASGPDAKTAQTTAADASNAVLAALKEAGVDENDLKTTDNTLNPKYRYEAKQCAQFAYCPPGNPILDGYDVTQTVVVKIRDINKAGDLITKAGEKGATNITNLVFSVENPKASQAEARAKAIADAKAQADVLAKNLGMHIVRMTGFSENTNGMPYPMANEAYGGSRVADKAMSVPQMPVGENTVKSTVSITYEIK